MTRADGPPAGEPSLTLLAAVSAGAVRAIVRSVDLEQQLSAALNGQASISLDLARGSVVDTPAIIPGAARPGALVVDVDLADPSQLLALRKMVGSSAGIPVIVTAASAGIEEMRQLMRLQIADFLPQPLVAADVLAAVNAALRKAQAADASRPQCRVISVVHRSGGMGATFIGMQVALELLGRGRKEARPRVCFVDLDLQSGDSATYLDVEPRLDIPEISRAPERLDLSLLQSMVSHHPSGLDILAPQPSLTELESVTSDGIAALLDLTCTQYEYVVVDMPQAWTRWSLPVIAGSDAVLLITQLSVAAVKQAKALLDKLAAEGVAGASINVVINRYRSGLFGRGVKRTTAERALGRSIDFLIADDPKLVSTALDHGQLLQQIKAGSSVEKEIRSMVGHLLLRLAPAGATTAKPGRRARA